MKTSALLIAMTAAIALAAPATNVLAQGKGVEDTPSARPSDAPSVRPSDRPGGAPGAGIGGRSTPAEPDTPPPVMRDEPPAPPERWNSAAGAIWHVRGRVRVAIGYSGVRSSADDARAS